MYEDGPSDHIRREMESHGWTISAKHVEEEAFDMSFGDNEQDHEDDNYGFYGF